AGARGVRHRDVLHHVQSEARRPASSAGMHDAVVFAHGCGSPVRAPREETRRRPRRDHTGRPLHAAPRRVPRRVRRRPVHAGQLRLPREPRRAAGGRAAGEAHVRGPLLFSDIDTPGLTALATYRAGGGYAALAEVVGRKSPDECIEVVKASGLRGRGGAGFPTGLKWSFVPKNSPKAKYIVCNADESEPGTFKDRELMEKTPLLLIEGLILAGYA